jgi:diacylglycerol kinase (ATP)
VEEILLISNATAGTNEEQALIAAVDVLMEHYHVDHVETSDADELGEALGLAAERRIVVVGGDGSLHAVVNALYSLRLLQESRLGLIPLGTGNDFARGVGLPLDPEEAARVVTADHLVPVDLIVDDRHQVVINNVHLGVGAQASRKAEKWKPRFGKVKLGRLGYVVGALTASVQPDFIEATVTVDGTELAPRGRIAQVAIGNGSTVGGGTELVPGADPSSGQLVVILSRAAGPLSRVAYVLRLRTGKHHLMKEVSRVTGHEVRVQGDSFYLSADGEIDGPHTCREWYLRPGAVRMYLPAMPAP